MRMTAAAVVMAIVGLLAGSALGQSRTLVDSWIVDRDNFNDTISPDANHGSSGNDRYAKGKQEGTLYCDWSDADLQALDAWLTAGPGPGVTYEVRLELSPVTWDASNPARVASVGTFTSTTDWVETEATHNQAAVGVDWNGTPGTTFWQLPDSTVNTQTMDGWIAPSVYGDYSTYWVNTVALDTALVTDLIGNADVRGVRMWSTQLENEQCYTKEQWPSTTPGPRLALYAVAPAQPGVATNTYDVDRDTGLMAGGQVNVNTGARGSVRAGKGSRDGGEQVLVGWNGNTTLAMRVFLESQAEANKLTLDEAAALGAVKVQYQMSGAYSDSADKVVNIETVWSQYDWVEGDGTNWDLNFGWSMGTAAVTWNNAQAVYIDADGDPLTTDDRTLDTANSLPWNDPYTGYNNQEYKHLHGTANSESFVGPLSHSPNSSNIVYNSVELDEAFWKDLIYDAASYNCVGIRQYGNGWGNDDNWNMYLKEGLAAPRLVITVTPAPGDATIDGKVNYLDLGIMATNYGKTAMAWTDGDFTLEGDVNYLDLGILATNYGWTSSLAGGGVGSVPEPVSVALLLAGSSLAALRRRKRS